MSHTSARYHSHPRGVEGSELSSAKHATVEPAVETKASSLQTPSPELEIPAAKAAGAITRACPACGATRRHALRFRTNGCNILQCGDCGLGRTETSGFDPAAYYTKDYLSGTCDRACGSPLEDRPGLADRFPIAAHAWNALGEHANCQSYRDTYQHVRCHACRSAESGLIGVRLASPPLRCDHPSQLHSKRASTSGSPCARNFLGICEFLFITNRGTSDGTCLSGAGVCRHPGL